MTPLLESTAISANDVEVRVVSSALTRMKPGINPLLYKGEDSPLPRDILYDYLVTIAQMILQPLNIDEIIRESKEKGIGLQEAAILYQRDVLEYNFGIERDYGCKEMSAIAKDYPDDEELNEAASNFMYSAMKSYGIGIERRWQSFAEKNKKSGFQRKHILEFFEACNAKSKFHVLVLVYHFTQ